MESLFCRDNEVIVVGGGNSAGQAAMFLSGIAKHLYHIIRGESLATSMSQYLVSHLRIPLASRFARTVRSETRRRIIPGARHVDKSRHKGAGSEADQERICDDRRGAQVRMALRHRAT